MVRAKRVFARLLHTDLHLHTLSRESRTRSIYAAIMSTSTAYQAARALQRLLPAKLPPSLSTKPGNLYQVLSRYPENGAGKAVHQTRWGRKAIEGSYWKVTRCQTKLQGTHGKAWGHLYWKGGYYATISVYCY